MTTESVPQPRPRATYWKVALPIVLAGLLIAAAVIAVVASLSASESEPAQVSIVGDVLLICFGLCPVVLCSGLIYLLLVVSIYGVNRLHDSSQRSLLRAQELTHKLADRTATTSDTLGRKSIDINAQFAILDQWLDNPNSETSESEEKSDGDDTGRESS